MRSATAKTISTYIVALVCGCGSDRLGNVPPCTLSDADRPAYSDLPETERLPFDIVVLVDNSASMAQEIERLEAALNEQLAGSLEDAGVDYRMIVVSHHGDDAGGVCIESPLSGTDCAPAPSHPVNTPRFAHYSLPIGSHDGWCKLLRAYDGGAPDEYSLVPGGWGSILRPEAMKYFIEMTDDGVECRYISDTFDDNDSKNGGLAAARAFDRTLLTLGDGAFGDADERRYRWYSIVGFASQSASGLAANEPIVEHLAANAMAPGTGSQALSALTGGLRFSVAQSGAFPEIFETIAGDTIDAVINRSLACE